MKRILSIVGFILTGVGLVAQHPNILISTNNQPNEPAIMIDPLNTNRMVAGSNIANVYYSTDAGFTWNEIVQTSSFGVWGDPVFSVDAAGNFYHFHLSNPAFGNWIDRIVCQKSTDGGVTWSDGSYTGLNGTAAQDKEWVAIDRATNIIYMTWTQFDNYGSGSPSDSSVILFSKSTDAGNSWTPAVRISDWAGDCIDSDETMEGAVPAIGPGGELYVTWIGHDTLFFDKSTDGGTTWLSNDMVITDIPGGWDYSIPGLQRCNGLPFIVCDTSLGSPFYGNIYINWSDQRNGTTDTDVWLLKSTDGGNTWSTPVVVNDDASGRHQFLTSMDIDPVNGNLWFVFYDRRNYSNTMTDVYMARSTDGGVTFENFKVSETPFTPTSTVFFGDYTHIAAHDDVIRPIWTRLAGGGLSVYTAIIDPDDLNPSASIEEEESLNLYSYPNPFDDEIYISFKLHGQEYIDLTIYDAVGKLVAKVIDHELMDLGHHLVSINSKAYHLSPGLYHYVLQKGNLTVTRKIIQLN